MDILLTDDGDIHGQSVVIRGWRLGLQRVLIRLHRFKGEWILDDQAGLDYLDWKDRKRGNLVGEIRDRVTAEILRVPEVVEVRQLRVRLDPNSRNVDIQADIRLADPDLPDPVQVFLDTWENTVRVTRP